MKAIVRIFAAIAFIAAALPAAAQDGEGFAVRLQALNQTPVSQSLNFRSWQKMFDMRVVDGNGQLIGRVEDIRIDESGAFAGLISDINRLDRKGGKAEHDAGAVTFRPEVSAFQIDLVPERKEELSAQALAAIAPAAGGGEIMSLKAMRGAEVRNNEGRWLGIVRDVIFAQDGTALTALIVEDVPGAAKYTRIALPFDADQIRLFSDYGRLQFRVEPEAAQALTDFARKTR